MRSSLNRRVDLQVAAIASVVLSLAIAGCGNNGLFNVTGQVTATDGSPLSGMNLMLRSEEGGSGWGSTDEEGHFDLGVTGTGGGIPAGEYTVVIVEDRGDPERPNPPRIHRKYHSPNTSGLSLTVPLESGAYDLVLDPPPTGRRKK